MMRKSILFYVVLGLPIMAIFGQQTKLCDCSQAALCATEGTKQMDNCRVECADWVKTYAKAGGAAEPLTKCFYEDGGPEGERMTNCMADKIGDYCIRPELLMSINMHMPEPSYEQWMEQLSANSSASSIPESGGAFIRKARAAFFVFRNFQKCMNNCAKRHSIACFKKASCAVSLPSEREKSLSIYNQCTLQNVHQDARDACRCLIQKHKVHQLVGICPLMSNTYLMRMV